MPKACPYNSKDYIYTYAEQMHRVFGLTLLTLILTSFNLPPPLNFIVYWLILHRKSGQRGFTARPDGRLHHLGNSPASRWAKVMGRLFFLESYCVTQPLTPRRLHQRLFCVPSCRIFTFVSGHCWLPMRGMDSSWRTFFMSGCLTAAGSRLKESGSWGLGPPPDLQAIF